MTNPCQDPTPEQEAMYELHGEIAYLKEQLADAVKIISAVFEEFDFRYDGLKDSGTLWMGEILAESREFLDQNDKR